jgi:hypothetical protein
MSERFDYIGWVRAWEKGMAEMGHPDARLDLLPINGGAAFTYAWVADLNKTWNMDEEHAHDSQPWEDAHRVFVVVDHLRPPTVMPSLELADRIGEPSHD